MYYGHTDFFQYLEQRLRALEEEQAKLREEIEACNKKDPIHIENIHYKIQELTVRELKGTLNIGMTALSDPKEIERWLQHDSEADVHLEDMEQGEENTQDSSTVRGIDTSEDSSVDI